MSNILYGHNQSKRKLYEDFLDKVNEKKISHSYEVVYEKVLMFVDYAKTMYLVDNSLDNPVIVCKISKKKIDVYDDNCAWANKVINALGGI